MASDEAPRPGFPASLSIDAMVKMLALVGTVTYGCLFLAYRSYYSRLHVNPGDVGVDNLYILSRCIGFLVVSAVLIALYYAIWFWLSRHPADRWRRVLGAFAMGAGLVGIVSLSLELQPGRASASMLVVLGISFLVTHLVALAISRKNEAAADVVVAVCAVSIAILIPAFVAVVQGGRMADMVLTGRAVEPYAMLGAPVLDIEAPRATITWVGPDAQKPENVFTERSFDGLVVGQGTSSVTVRTTIDGRTEFVKLPVTSVAVVIHE